MSAALLCTAELLDKGVEQCMAVILGQADAPTEASDVLCLREETVPSPCYCKGADRLRLSANGATSIAQTGDGSTSLKILTIPPGAPHGDLLLNTNHTHVPLGLMRYVRSIWDGRIKLGRIHWGSSSPHPDDRSSSRSPIPAARRHD
eukprot:COSAG01_NODE_678_length_14293_cov_14.229388_3_plen_147_part_00